MSAQAGFILLHRQITEWEWYQNPNTFRVFLHILLKANYMDGRFEGKEIKRGDLVTSLPSLAEQTKLSIQQVRTALDHLKSTGEITDRTYSKYRVITVVKYNDYQQDNRQNNSQSTGNQQAGNSQSTGNQQQYNKNNKGKREQGNNHQIFVIPTVDDVEAYCEEKGIFGFDAQKFVDYYTSNGWMVGRNRMRDWRAAIRTWRKNDEEREQQRRYAAADLPY